MSSPAAKKVTIVRAGAQGIVFDPEEIEIFIEGIKANGIDVIKKVNTA
jgi:hypothetical protein